MSHKAKHKRKLLLKAESSPNIKNAAMVDIYLEMCVTRQM